MKRASKTRTTVKLADLQQELGISEGQLYQWLRDAKVYLVEGQKNIDAAQATQLKQYLHKKRRTEELKQKVITLPSIIRVQGLAEALEIPVGEVLSTLLKNGVLATLNDEIDYETAAIIAADLGYTTEESVAALEQDVLTPEKVAEILKKEDPTAQRVRPPVVTLMGHVDHGKTTLLDTIRSANVAAKEAGGITQAISSYQVEHDRRTITFIDTPGHETFQFMRQRGASLADIAILVVAADDGVKAQTTEAIKNAQVAGVPIIVAINKVDKNTANVDKVKTQLSESGLTPDEWGGGVSMVPVSALKGQGIDTLLETILLTADLHPPKAIFDRPAIGTVIESKLDKALGPIATVLIQTGTLLAGEAIVIGRTAGRVRRLLDFKGKAQAAATPGISTTVVGLEDVPQAGDIMQVVEATETARLKASERRAPVKSLVKAEEGDERPVLALVIKADTKGSLEALEQMIRSMVPPEIRLSLIRSQVGEVSDSDILTARAAHALIYAFNSRVMGMARKLADKEKVTIKLFNVIYKLSEDIRQEIDQRLPVDIVRHDVGRLKVLKVFFSIQQRKIVGGDVASGEIQLKDKIVVRRKEKEDSVVVGEGEVIELQREKRAIEKAQQGDQVGVTYQGRGKIKEGDVLEIYREQRVKKVATL